MFDFTFGNNTFRNTVVEDTDNITDTAIVLFKASDIKKIKDNVGNIGERNEYQCHYSALVRTQTFQDGSKHHTILPLIYYNYKQSVSGVHIDFEMKDVLEKSKEVQEQSLKLYNILKKKMILLDKNNQDISYKLSLFNTIHKHP